MVLADIVVEDEFGNETKDDIALRILKNPNDYLTQSEFIKLMTNTYLLEGETFPILNGAQIHLASNVFTELDDNLVEHFNIGGHDTSIYDSSCEKYWCRSFKRKRSS